MLIKEVTIQNQAGFHIRPAQLFVEESMQFKSDVTVKSENGVETDGKSILGLMTMGLEKGAKLIIEINGEDEELAMNALVELVNNKFGEE